MRTAEIEAYKKQLKLTRNQRETLVGLLLGDGCLETQNKGLTYRLKIEQSESHKRYLFHLYEMFKEWVRTPPKQRKVFSQGSSSFNWVFQTLSHSAFRFYAQQFYGHDNQKVVPRLIHRWLTPCSLAYWYMDDGSIKSKESNGVIFNTQGFVLKEVSRLCSVLEQKFALDAKPRKQKEGHQIYVSGRSLETFKNLVNPYIIPEMKYKIPQKKTNTVA